MSKLTGINFQHFHLKFDGGLRKGDVLQCDSGNINYTIIIIDVITDLEYYIMLKTNDSRQFIPDEFLEHNTIWNLNPPPFETRDKMKYRIVDDIFN